MIEMMRNVPSRRTMVLIEHFHGMVRRIPQRATAFGHRDNAYNVLINSRWAAPEHDLANIKWTTALYNSLLVEHEASVYVNYLADEGHGGIRRAYGFASLNRLRRLKNQFDPTNLFRSNQNIAPLQLENDEGR